MDICKKLCDDTKIKKLVSQVAGIQTSGRADMLGRYKELEKYTDPVIFPLSLSLINSTAWSLVLERKYHSLDEGEGFSHAQVLLVPPTKQNLIFKYFFPTWEFHSIHTHYGVIIFFPLEARSMAQQLLIEFYVKHLIVFFKQRHVFIVRLWYVCVVGIS